MSAAEGVDAILVNDGATGSVDVTDMTAVGAFVATALALGTANDDAGVKLTFLPGTAPYQIELDSAGVGILLDGTATVQASNVEICLMPGAILEPKDATVTTMLKVEDGVGFRLTGGGLIRRPTGADIASGILVHVDASLAHVANDCVIRDVQFEGINTAAGCTALLIDGINSTNLSANILVENCSFAGDDTTNYTWIRVNHCRHTRIINNVFRPAIISGVIQGQSNGNYGIRLVNCPRSVVNGNSFHNCANAEAAISLEVSSSEEGGHSVVSNNTMEASVGQTVYLVKIACDFVLITGNELGRHDDLEAGVFVTKKPSGDIPRGISIINNLFHSYSADVDAPTNRYGIHLEAVEGALVAGNHFFNMHQGGTFCRVDASPDTYRVKFDFNSNLVLGSELAGDEATTYWRLDAATMYDSLIPVEQWAVQKDCRVGKEQAWPEFTA